MLKKLGRSCAFAGKVGEDMFGYLLRDVAAQAGICMDRLVYDKDVRTTLAFVKTSESGDRDFSFCRNPGADMMLTEDELPLSVIADSRIFHFGTLSMTPEGVRRATHKAIAHAKTSGAILSFNPNLRLPLWDSLDEAKKQIEYGLARCDVLKIADNELEFMTGETDFDKGAAILREKYPNIRLFNVTAGAEGGYSYYEDKRVFVPSCKLGGVIEATGAGRGRKAAAMKRVRNRNGFFIICMAIPSSGLPAFSPVCGPDGPGIRAGVVLCPQYLPGYPAG